MASTAPLVHLDIGVRVQHRLDSTKPVGVVVGLIFGPPELVVVRWHDRSTSFEALEDLVDVRQAA